MTGKLFISCILASGMSAVTVPLAAAQSESTQPAPSTDSKLIRPQGYLDPNFGSATDKPHAGTPLQPAPSAYPEPQAANPEAPGWYKDSPQRYDHPAKPRHFRAPKSQARVQVTDDSAPQQELAQENATPIPQYGDEQSQQDQAQQPDQSQPQDDAQQYQTPEYNNVQPVPQYYGQQGQQAYAQPPQQDQGYADQDYPDQDNNQPNYGPDDQGQQYSAQPTQQPLSAQQLEQLVAPIALYPDQLLAQILTGSTYPAQITAADQWLHNMKGASADQIASAVSAQTQWDPSIKALTAFPQVLDMLNSNLQWTAALGNAYYNQPQDVMSTVQMLRERAQQAGNLQSTPQQQVTQDPGYIQIEPTNPQYVYVPSYNPWYAYGSPIDPYPAFGFGNWGLYVGGGIRFGLGFAVGPFLGMPWGWNSWGFDWAGCGILYRHDYYWSHSREVRDWGFEHGGRRWNGGGRGWYHGGREMSRFGDYRHQAIPVHQGPLGRGTGGPRQLGGREGFNGREGGRPNVNGREGFGHVQGGGPTRPESPRQQAYNHMPETYGRPQQFQRGPAPRGPESFNNRPQQFGGREAYPGGGRPLGARPEPYRSLPENRGFANAPRMGNGYGQYPRPSQGFGGRPSAPIQNYGNRQFGYAQPSAPRGGFGQAYGRPQQHGGGGFPGFGGGHSTPSYGGGGHAFGGGGHAFGGGGGHSFGGGGGGGHFGGGGHSGGGHSGGGHRR